MAGDRPADRGGFIPTSPDPNELTQPFETPRVLDPMGSAPGFVDASGNRVDGAGFSGSGLGGGRGSSGGGRSSSGAGTSGSNAKGAARPKAGGANNAENQSDDEKCDAECQKKKKRDQELGTDPGNKQFRQREADLARRIEQQQGVSLKRSPDSAYDFIDEKGRTYDGVGPVPTQYFNSNSFNSQIGDHLNKQGLDFVPVDYTGLNFLQTQSVNSYISTLNPIQQSRIIKIGL